MVYLVYFFYLWSHLVFLGLMLVLLYYFWGLVLLFLLLLFCFEYFIADINGTIIYIIGDIKCRVYWYCFYGWLTFIPVFYIEDYGVINTPLLFINIILFLIILLLYLSGMFDCYSCSCYIYSLTYILYFYYSISLSRHIFIFLLYLQFYLLLFYLYWYLFIWDYFD